MRLPRDRERALILSLLRDHDQCVVFPQEAYRRPDGFLAVHRDGLQELLHRRLYRLVRDVPLGRAKLSRTCDTWGCQNPWHFALAPVLETGSHHACPNGHVYADTGVTASGHCLICATARRAHRSHGGLDGGAINAAKDHCPAGHAYTDANTYRQRTGSGIRRKCRACNLAATRAKRAVATTIPSPV